jgi:hypothetical protein
MQDFNMLAAHIVQSILLRQRCSGLECECAAALLLLLLLQCCSNAAAAAGLLMSL